MGVLQDISLTTSGRIRSKRFITLHGKFFLQRTRLARVRGPSRLECRLDTSKEPPEERFMRI